MDNGNIIEATGVHKTYDTGTVKVHALRGIDVNIQQGEMVSLIGPSGCGKTTLLNCLSGLDSISEGSVKIEGTEIATMSDTEKTAYRAQHIGFIFQFYNLLPVLNAVENVELPLLVAHIKPEDARKKAIKTLELVDLTGWEEHLPSELSGGQRQRVTIARALVNDPLIVFGDELTGDLDHDTSNVIMDLICRLNKENNQTFVIVTHDNKVAERAHRVLKMGSGIIEKQYHPTRW